MRSTSRMCWESHPRYFGTRQFLLRTCDWEGASVGCMLSVCWNGRYMSEWYWLGGHRMLLNLRGMLESQKIHSQFVPTTCHGTLLQLSSTSLPQSAYLDEDEIMERRRDEERFWAEDVCPTDSLCIDITSLPEHGMYFYHIILPLRIYIRPFNRNPGVSMAFGRTFSDFLSRNWRAGGR